jgi:hypothetical protein
MVSAPALDDIRLENNHPNITYFLSNGTIAVCDSVLSVIASGGSAAVLSNGTTLQPYGMVLTSKTAYANISFHGVFFIRLVVTALILCT